jgi:hypothetical protein
MDPIIATWSVKVVAREADPTLDIDRQLGSEPPAAAPVEAPTNAQLEEAIVKGLAAELGLTVTASAERTDK